MKFPSIQNTQMFLTFKAHCLLSPAALKHSLRRFSSFNLSANVRLKILNRWKNIEILAELQGEKWYVLGRGELKGLDRGNLKLGCREYEKKIKSRPPALRWPGK